MSRQTIIRHGLKTWFNEQYCIKLTRLYTNVDVDASLRVCGTNSSIQQCQCCYDVIGGCTICHRLRSITPLKLYRRRQHPGIAAAAVAAAAAAIDDGVKRVISMGHATHGVNA